MAGQTFSYQFTKSGLYNYYCMVHPWSEGSVIVKEGVYSPTPSSVSTSKIPTNLILDPVPNIKAKGSVDFSGQLLTEDRKTNIPNTSIKLVFTGFTVNGLDHYTTTTNSFGKFNVGFNGPNPTTKKDYAVQAFYNGSLKFESSQSQTEYYTVTPTTSSQPSTSSLGGPTFLKLEVETDERTVTISGKLTDKATKKFVVRNEAVTLIPSGFSFSKNVNGCYIEGSYVSCSPNHSTCLSSYLPNCVLKTNTGTGEFAVRFQLPVGEDYSVQAVFHGNNQWDSSKSLTQSFTVTSTSKSPPPTSTSSGDFGWIWLVIIAGVVCAVVVVVLAKRSNGKNKTPTTTPQRRTFGVKQPKKRRTGSPASVTPSGESASTFAHYECPDCHSDNIIQYQDGAESCSDCGWKS
jgi:hypothetical protein